LDATYARKKAGLTGPAPAPAEVTGGTTQDQEPAPPEIPGLEFIRQGSGWEKIDLFGVSRAPVPYEVFRLRLAEQNECPDAAGVPGLPDRPVAPIGSL